jgi:hypothetical protein
VLRPLVGAAGVAAHDEIALGDEDEVAIQRLGQLQGIGGSQAVLELGSGVEGYWLDACFADQVDHERCG